MPVKKYYFGVDLAPVHEASRQGEAINNGSPAEVTPVVVGTRVGKNSADTCAPLLFLFVSYLREVNRQCQTSNSSFHRI